MTHINVRVGDTANTAEMKDGNLVTANDSALADELNAGREFMQEFLGTFESLAK